MRILGIITVLVMQILNVTAQNKLPEEIELKGQIFVKAMGSIRLKNTHNLDVYLFATTDRHSIIIKLINKYWSDSTKLRPKLLSKAPIIKVIVHRVEDCDDTYGEFIRTQDKIVETIWNKSKYRMEPFIYYKKAGKPIVDDNYFLKCYQMDENDFVIEK
jgi:hypothetical protein